MMDGDGGMSFSYKLNDIIELLQLFSEHKVHPLFEFIPFFFQNRPILMGVPIGSATL